MPPKVKTKSQVNFLRYPDGEVKNGSFSSDHPIYVYITLFVLRMQ